MRRVIPPFNLLENSVSWITSPCAFRNYLLFITSIFIRITSRAEPYKNVAETKEDIVNCKWYGTLRTDMFSVKLEKCWRKCRNGWRKNSELSTWVLLRPTNLQTSQAGSWLSARCLQCCRAQGQGRAPEVAQRGGDRLPLMAPWRVNLQQGSKLHFTLSFWGRTGSHQECWASRDGGAHGIWDKGKWQNVKHMSYFNQWEDEGMTWKHHAYGADNLTHRDAVSYK